MPPTGLLQCHLYRFGRGDTVLAALGDTRTDAYILPEGRSVELSGRAACGRLEYLALERGQVYAGGSVFGVPRCGAAQFRSGIISPMKVLDPIPASRPI